MSELADRLPGEIILASYNNDQRDRLVERYVDATARTAATPLPVPGTVSYLTSTGVFSIFDGASWVDYATDASVAVLHDHLFSQMQTAQNRMGSTESELASLVIPTSGDWLATWTSRWDATSADGGLDQRLTFILRVDGSLTNNWQTQNTSRLPNDGDITWEGFGTWSYPLIGLTAGQDVSVGATGIGSWVQAPDVSLYMLELQRYDPGVLSIN